MDGLFGSSALGQSARGIGAVEHVTGQLTAGGVDVVTPRLADGGDHPALVEDLAEAQHHSTRGALQAGIGEGIEGNQVDLAGNAPSAMVAHQFQQLSGMFGLIVDTVEHAVLEGDEEDEVLGDDDAKGVFTFKLLEQVGIKVDVVGGAVKGDAEEEIGSGVRRWEEWIGMCL